MFIVPITQMPSITSLKDAASLAPVTSATSSFSDIFKSVIENQQQTEAISNQDTYNLAMGKADDLHTIMINAEKATAALELTVQMTSRAIGAYNEIMRMQI